jgi:hypothetical protein
MPGLNRTGPEGQGSQTGRGLGKCNPNKKINQSETNETMQFKNTGRGLARRLRLRKGNECSGNRGMGRNYVEAK